MLETPLRTTPRPPGWEPGRLPKLPAGVPVGFDTETTGLKWWRADRPIGISLAWREDGRLRSCYLPFAHRGGGNLDPTRVREWARDALRGRTLAGLNLPFDAHMSRAWGLDLEGMGCRLADVGHRAALLDDHRREFNLESIARDELGEGKVEGLYAPMMSEYGAWQVEKYAEKDAELVLRILERQEPRLAQQQLEPVVDLEDAVIWPTMEMERNGALLDVEKLRGWERDSERELTTLYLKLAGVAGFRVNPDSPDDMTRLFRDRKIEVTTWTQGSVDGRVPPRPSFTAAVLEAAAQRDEVVALALRVARLSDLRSKYLVPYARTVEDDGILRFSLHQLRGDQYGTVSGRFSSSKACGEGANIQQVMAVEKQVRNQRGLRAYIIRELFIAAPGQLLGMSDAKQIEYRVFAHFAGSGRILDMYEKDPDADFHEVTGAIVREHRPDFDRKRIKNCNFAVLFGSGIKNFAAMLNTDEADARAALYVYDRALPEGRRLMRRAMAVAETRGYVKTIFGRRARFPKQQRLHSALNRVVQGSAAELMKKKLVELYRERRRLGIMLRMTIHDETVFDALDREAAKRAHVLLNEQTTPLRVPILWDTQVGPNWATMQSVI